VAKKTGIAADVLALPTGGSELRPLGEKFQPDLYSGTGNFSIPLSVPPGHNGIAPDLTLTYSTGHGDGPFGHGWDIWAMGVSRSTLGGLPRYDVDPEAPPDRFVLSGAEELVSVGDGRFRPRTDAKFWLVRREDGHWTVTTKDGSVYRLGGTDGARVRQNGRVFAWLVDEIVDPNGNRIEWRYRRDGDRLYFDEISYGPFRITFDYEERPDPFTDHRAGFVIETRLRCTTIRILSARAPSNLIRRYVLEYDAPDPRRLSLLRRVTLEGPDGTSLPGTTFGYEPLDLAASSYRRFSSPDGAPPPRELPAADTSLVDLSGDGLPDVLATGPDGPLLWRNLGDLRWSRPSRLRDFPGQATLEDAGVLFADLEGNGTADLLWAAPPMQGYFPNAAGLDWEPMVRYRTTLPFSFGDPSVKLYDVDGDGRIDAVVARPEAFLLFRNLGRDGWSDRVQVVRRRHDLDLFPDIAFEDPHTFVADMNGDGLTDLVHVRSGEVSYWPYQGHGDWAPRVRMAGSPVLPRNYDIANLFLSDIDGDGVDDLVYVDSDRTLVWLNRGGRGFSDTIIIAPTPPAGSGTVLPADMRGQGRPGLLFSYQRDMPGADQYRFLSLGGDTPPYLMTSIDNGMGSVTRIAYRSSTSFQMDDLAVGRPWRTFLPFPLQVTAGITVEDRHAGVTSRTEYRYHDGHYDGLEREFRGFGQVEEIQVGDDAEPTIVRENLFEPGTDPALPERERRAMPAELRDARRALRGTLKRLRVFAIEPGAPADARVLREEIDNEWAVRTEFDGPAGRVLFPHQLEGRQTEHAGPELTGPSRRIVVRYLDYDAFGNLLGQEQTTGVLQPDGTFAEDGFRRETYAYAHAPERWVVGMLARTAVLDRDGTLQGAVQYHYDGDAFVGLPLGAVERGNLTRIEELVWRSEQAPAEFGAIDLGAIGYHQTDEGWWRNKFRHRRNSNGTVAELMDTLGALASVVYDDDGLYPVEVVDAVGLRTRADYDHSVEAIASITNPSGYVDGRRYDGVGRVTHIFRTADDGSQQLHRVVRYAAAAPDSPASITTLICRAHGRQPEEFADPTLPPEEVDGVFAQRVFYSGAGVEMQRIATAEAAAEGPRTVVSGRRRFTVRGRTLSEAEPAFGTGFELQPGAAEGPEHRFRYDYRGRVVQSIRPDGARRVTLYAPLASEAYDEAASQTMATPTRVEAYNGRGRLVAVTEGPASDAMATTRYSYDFNDNLAEIVDARGIEALSSTFDLVGRRARAEHVDAGVRRYLLDGNDNLVALIDARGLVIRNGYDAIGRITTVDRAEDDQLTPLRRYRYDSDPARPGLAFIMGRLAAVDDESGHVSFSYNAGGQPLEVSRTFADGRALTTSRTYTALGALASLTYPDGAVVTYAYNEAMLLEAIPGFVSGVSYTAKAQIEEILYENGISARYRYGAPLTRLERIDIVGPGDAALQTLTYEHDPVANILAIDETFGGTTVRQTFGYDGLNRIVSRQVGAAAAGGYAYDPVGNILVNDDGVAGPLEYGAAAHPDRLSRYRPLDAAAASDVDYDAAGNMTRRGDLTNLSYDPFNRLSTVTRSDGTVVGFAYDHRGGRTRRTVERNGATTETIYADDLFEDGPEGRVRYVRAPFGLVAEIRVDGTGAESRRIHHTDHVGSTRLLTDEAGAVLARQTYSPFGIGEAAAGPQRYVGREFEPAIGLYLLGARFYDPAVGRFITADILIVEDPIRFIHAPQMLNLYAYAGNNPLRFRDPSGRFLIVAALIGLAIGALIGALVAAEQGGDASDILLGALIGGAVGFLVGGFGLLGSALMGSGVGALKAAITGDDKIFTAAAIGFVFGAAGGMADWIPAVAGQGFWVDVTNFAIEVGVDAAISGVQSGVSSAVAGKNFWDGFSSGLLTGALLSSAKVLVFGIKYDPFSKASKNDVMRQFAKDNAADRSYVAAKVQKAGFPKLRGVEFRRHGLFDIVNGGRSFVLGSNVNMASGQEFDIQTLAHELRHIAQQQQLTLGSLEFYTVWTWQAITKGNVAYMNIPANTTFEVATVP
jgi:RHS repeat-associated protein